jgi:hypothetical protein
MTQESNHFLLGFILKEDNEVTFMGKPVRRSLERERENVIKCTLKEKGSDSILF